MTEHQRILLSAIGIMALVSLSVSGIAIYVLYRAAFEVHKARLEEVVLSRARLIEAVGRFDAQFSQDDFPGGAREATLSQVIEAHEMPSGRIGGQRLPRCLCVCFCSRTCAHTTVLWTCSTPPHRCAMQI